MLLITALAIIGFAAAFHAQWALGGKFGFSVSLPQHLDGSPVMGQRLAWWRPASGVVALFLVVLSILLLHQTGHLRLGLPGDLVRGTLLVVGAAFVLRAIVPNRYVGFLKTLRTTRWARYDTRLYSPLFLILGLLILRLLF